MNLDGVIFLELFLAVCSSYTATRAKDVVMQLEQFTFIVYILSFLSSNNNCSYDFIIATYTLKSYTSISLHF